LEGDSHLAVPGIFRIDANVERETITFEGTANSRKFLAKFAATCRAQNINDAREKCYRALTPVLSNFSLKWDVPLAVCQIDVKELRKGTLQMSHRNPFQEISLKGQFEFALNPDLRVYGSIYREALITESIDYQFLCFFRLIESVRARRVRLAREAKRQGGQHKKPRETYPRTRAEAEVFLNLILPVRTSKSDQLVLDAILVPEALGKEFSVIIETYLKPIRDNIGHTLLQRAEELVSIDDHRSRQRVEKWLPPTKCIARAMMKSDFAADLQ